MSPSVTLTQQAQYFPGTPRMVTGYLWAVSTSSMPYVINTLHHCCNFLNSAFRMHLKCTSLPFNKGKGKKTTHPNFLSLELCFPTLLFILPTLFGSVKEIHSSHKYQKSTEAQKMTPKCCKRTSHKCLPIPGIHWYFGSDISRGKIPPPFFFCLFLFQETHADVNHVFSHLLPLLNK